jgi:Ca-activated chloride channel family protein
MMRFIEWPLALLAVPLLALLSMLAFRTERRSRAMRLAKFGTLPMLARLAPFGARLGLWRTLRTTTALVCCGLAFAGPRWGIVGTFSQSTGVDVAVVMDASLSMMAPDATPTRLDNAKNVIRQLRAASPNDRFALVAFAEHSYVLSPLTTDSSAFNM